MGGIRLIVGLGNPGPEYAATRHNVGYWLIDAIVRREGGQLRAERKFHGEVGQVTLAQQPCWLLKPTTFMNRSGLAVAALSQYYKIHPEQILVAHDELDLPPGRIKVKQDGGHAGHNGLRSTIAALGSPSFVRYRIGIGHPGDKDQVSHYVLHPPSAAERQKIMAVITEAVAAVDELVRGDCDAAMRRLHALK